MAELLWLEGFSVEKAENKETESWTGQRANVPGARKKDVRWTPFVWPVGTRPRSNSCRFFRHRF